MQDIIRLLPDSIANQIAAGEVVQRPASVVKELLENAVDANSKHIQLIIKDAGRTLVQVIDDGAGMSETDARLSFERHATSKIRTADDLFKIKTMGFRGEALASIAAVAQVEMRTRRSSDEVGTLLRIEGSDLKAQESVACLSGTNILVKNLFYNVPARRNFLKTNSVEMRHILDEFQRVALANPEIAFSLYHNDTEVYNLYGGKLSRRIVDMFGKNYRENLVACQESTHYIEVKGYIGKPEFARKTRGEQFFFVNNRFIKHSYLHHAVLAAFEGLVPDGSHPFYVLFIDIDPSHIDINIHPTKTEIKFDDERSIYTLLLAVIKKAIGIHHFAPSIDFDANVNFMTPSFGSQPKSVLPPQPSSWDKLPPLQNDTSREQSNLRNWEQLFEGMKPEPEQAKLELINTEPVFASNTDNTIQDVPLPNFFQFQNRFLFSVNQSGLMVIDQRAALERIYYDRYRRSLQTNTNTVTQPLLFPATVMLSQADVEVVLEFQDEIKLLGFDFDLLGKDTLVVRSLPSELPNVSTQEIFEELVEQIKLNVADLKIDRTHATSLILARRFAGRSVRRMLPEEIENLIGQLFTSSNPNYTPTGEPTFVVLTLDKLAALFKQ